MKNKFLASVALFLVFIICTTSFIGCDKTPAVLKTHLLYEPKYPSMAKYPSSENNEKQYEKWSADKKSRRQYYGMGDGLEDFYTSTAAEFLTGSTNENRVYSPVNVYMALAMLAEITYGDSRAQILSLLGADSIESLRSQVYGVWNANYSDDGAVTSILANSVWLDKELKYNKKTLETLANKYYASSFSGEMGSKKYNKALRTWLNEQTGGLLKGMTDNIELSPETLVALASTVYFQAKWENEFSEGKTEEKTFHAPSGDVKIDFMHDTDTFGRYYYGEKFSATSKALEGSGSMFFILPDENVSVNELLEDTEALSFLASNGEWEKGTTLKVNLAVPKFDVSSRTDLASGLKDLGVTDCFDFERGNFAPLFKNENYQPEKIAVSSVDHGVRVAIDEEGVTAAAYTVIPVCGSPMPPEDEIDFVLDRPFIFVITSDDGTPMFTGVVNQP